MRYMVKNVRGKFLAHGSARYTTVFKRAEFFETFAAAKAQCCKTDYVVAVEAVRMMHWREGSFEYIQTKRTRHELG